MKVTRPRLQGASPVDGAYLPALDGLRAVSILLVVLSHLGLDRLLPGAFGVTLFFFISGYLITRQLLQALGRTGRVGLTGFYTRRALRLMPAGLAYIAVAGTAFAAAGGRITPGGWAAAVFYGANYYDLWAGYRSSLAGVRHPFNILWSLAIEEHFYLVWPMLLGLIWRSRHLFLIVVLACAAVLIWRATLLDFCFVPGAPAVCAPANPNVLWRYNRLYLATDTRLDSIAWGALLAIAEWRRAAWAGLAAKAWPVTGAALAVLAVSFLLPGPLGRHVLRPSLQGAALAFLLPALLHRDTWVRRMLSTPQAVLVGRLSYSLYLWHWAAMALADGSAPRNHVAWLGIAVPLAGLLAVVSYYGIERPMLGLRRRFGSRAVG